MTDPLMYGWIILKTNCLKSKPVPTHELLHPLLIVHFCENRAGNNGIDPTWAHSCSIMSIAITDPFVNITRKNIVQAVYAPPAARFVNTLLVIRHQWHVLVFQHSFFSCWQ